MKLIVGLGNPGNEYKQTRHNAGFMFIDELASVYNIAVSKKRYKSFFGKGAINDIEVVLAKPQTYMNLSGESVVLMLKGFNLSADDLIIIHDDMDMDIGRLRIRDKGSHGGHRGIKSIIDAIGTDSFVRIKIGIGRPRAGMDSSDYVLSNFKKDELPILKEVKKMASDAILFLIKDDTVAAMNRFNK
ncbi:MAG: aminoacyl-tRNA hydrolase [Nitrospirae bacterium RBG_19FT_COMBO_42_15]|nr:MAG: aminoacyl-tRNA hydrolase [Nitrospirae bacterium RBG_19FT_COMBO_42_15]